MHQIDTIFHVHFFLIFRQWGKNPHLLTNFGCLISTKLQSIRIKLAWKTLNSFPQITGRAWGLWQERAVSGQKWSSLLSFLVWSIRSCWKCCKYLCIAHLSAKSIFYEQKYFYIHFNFYLFYSFLLLLENHLCLSILGKGLCYVKSLSCRQI